MPATTEPETSDPPGAWLNRQAPGWLGPGLTMIALIESAIIVAQAWLIAAIAFRAFIGQQPPAEIMPSMWALLGVLAARALLGGARQLAAGRASVRVRRTVRLRLIRNMAAAAPANMPTDGELVSTFDDQVEAFDAFYGRFLPQRITAMVVPLTILAFVFANDWLAGLLLILTAPLIPLFMVLIGLGAEKLAQDQFRSLARLGGWFLDQVRGAATVRLFGAEALAKDQVRRRTHALRQQTMRVLRLAFLSSAVLEFFSAVAIASLAIYIGLGLLGYLTFGPAPELTLQAGLFVLLLAPEFFQPLRALSQGWHDRADALAATAAVRAVIDLPPARRRAEPAFAPPVARTCGVALRGVGFAYPGREAILRDVDLDVAPGEKLVLTGASGSGKSTLIAMLAGFAEPSHGTLELDGRDLTRFSDPALRAHVAWLGQRPVLFAGTIAENIAMGWASATRTQIETIADQASVGEFADRLPQGLDSPVGEDGYGFSGGQAQRIALARALIRPRPLILLDEPTASLDPASEAAVLAALAKLLAEREATVICAAHSAATMAWADRVLAIESGRLQCVR